MSDRGTVPLSPVVCAVHEDAFIVTGRRRVGLLFTRGCSGTDEPLRQPVRVEPRR